jgi:hypothetical protein
VFVSCSKQVQNEKKFPIPSLPNTQSAFRDGRQRQQAADDAMKMCMCKSRLHKNFRRRSKKKDCTHLNTTTKTAAASAAKQKEEFFRFLFCFDGRNRRELCVDFYLHYTSDVASLSHTTRPDEVKELSL